MNHDTNQCAKRRFYIDPSAISEAHALISGSDARHIKTVLRLKPGDLIELCDGRGTEYIARIESFSDKGVIVFIIRSYSSERESPVQIIIAQSLLKENKMDDLIRQLTELGIAKWIPFIAKRSVSKPDIHRFEARRRRWKTIAIEAMKQCRRSIIPEIAELVSFEEALQLGKSCVKKIIFWENESQPLMKNPDQKRYDTVYIMMGPEGGFTHQEVETAKESGFQTATLGPRILRAETATIAACTLIQFIFGDMGLSKEFKNSH